MADRITLCTVGSGNFELPIDYRCVLEKPNDTRDHVVEYTLPGGKHVLLVADGHCVGSTAGKGKRN